MKSKLDIRPSPIAGRWYEANPQRLAAEVDGYLEAAHLPPLAGEPIAVLAPHAGLRYSGHVAGAAFAAFMGRTPELVVVAAPMHQAYPAPFLTTAHSAYETPLGIVPVERSALAALEARVAGTLGLHLEAVANDAEHALEIELPFLQRALAADFSLLPIMVRETNPQALRLMAEKLVEVLAGRDALLVASTDLSHFYPEPQANRLDQELLRRVEQFDPEAVLHAELEGVGYACGRGAAALVMWAAKALGADQAQVVRYATSGATTGDFTQVVGYGAAVFTRPETQTKNDGE